MLWKCVAVRKAEVNRSCDELRQSECFEYGPMSYCKVSALSIVGVVQGKQLRPPKEVRVTLGSQYAAYRNTLK